MNPLSVTIQVSYLFERNEEEGATYCNKFVFTIPECFLNSIKLVLSVKHTFFILFNVLFGRHVSTFYLVIIRPFT